VCARGLGEWQCSDRLKADWFLFVNGYWALVCYRSFVGRAVLTRRGIRNLCRSATFISRDYDDGRAARPSVASVSVRVGAIEINGIAAPQRVVLTGHVDHQLALENKDEFGSWMHVWI